MKRSVNTRLPQRDRPRMAHHFLGMAMCCGLVLPTPAQASTSDAYFRVQIKKINQYLDDTFCQDALLLALETQQKEGGDALFELREGIARAQLCLGRIPETLAVLDETERVITVSPEERTRLNRMREQVRAQFGELKLRLPRNRRDKIRVQLAGKPDDPSLLPRMEEVQELLRSGTVMVPDSRLFLPRGKYEIDSVAFEIRDFEGVTFVIGKQRPPVSQRLSLGDGQALGFGYLSLTGWQGDQLPIQQLSGGSQEVIDVDRLGSSAGAFMEVSSTRASLWGTLGYVGTRLDLQLRPGVSLPGDVVSEGNPGLAQSWASAGASLHRQLPVKGGLSVTYGGGLRVLRYNWMEYLALVSLEDENGEGAPGTNDPYSGETTNISRMPIYMPTWGGGLELTAASHWQLMLGKQPLQLGLELRAGAAALFPTQRTGEERIDTGAGDVILRWRLYQERLWGSYGGGLLVFRLPLF